ncbi:MAG: TIGR02281 family clan AA aspartic protease [Magnetococcales bacterium]|nr:TIGR02281 family clan AA aspartic protease [Magnetococcales bacterium]MBF0149811.1 TIGR02281 family clan AA aspartic protease [Magnetococcales bacterium]MBF0174960.1 TIGR02281 family clan AA aspartic protease [Magnetococcales bacterium]MBF0346400.1 TIGR02281 family clan AA aspartic protease [Magnetococcales bacterium]MBF0630771.1 TIGR02281 family clan AA aspartic protease [Magnetococcales bacterium]
MIRGPGRRFTVVFVVLTLLALGLQFLVTGAIWGHPSQETIASALFSILMVSWMLSSTRWRGGFKIFKMTAPWLVVLFILFSGYVYRHELSGVGQRLLAAFLPHAGVESKPGSMQFVRADDGHFHIQARINGVGVSFLADTGASDIILDRKTASRIGIDLDRLQFSKVYETANGRVRGAPVLLDEFTLGSLVFRRLPASINESNMDQPLLGMAFFNRLQGFEVQKDRLTIRWTAR